MSRRYDAIVVGGGHNGLVAAAYMARAGLDVCLLERRQLVGGAAVTEELWPGYRLSRASYVVSLLLPEIVRDLELVRFGYDVIKLEPGGIHPFADGDVVVHHGNGRRFAEQLRRYSPADADAYADYESTLDELAEVVRPLLRLAPPSSPRSPGDLADVVRTLGRGRLARRHLARLTDLMTLSVGDYLRQWFSHERTLAVLCGSGVIGTWAGPETPGTAYVLLHHVIGEVDGVRGAWGIPRGGMGGLSDALAASARWAGAEIRLDAAVSRIRTGGGRVAGVTLADGTELDAERVLSSLHPCTALLDLVGVEHLPDELVRELGAYRSRSGVVKINAVLGEAPQFTCLRGTGLPATAAVEFLLQDSIGEVERAWDDAKHGCASQRPFVDGLVHSLLDDGLVPPGSGHHTLSLFTQFGPYELRDGTWDDERDAYAHRVFDLIGEFAPNVPGSVLHYEVLAPPDLERIFGLVGGNIFHGEMTLDQLFVFRPALDAGAFRTPIRGLYLCGAGSHPGGGVCGAPGYLGARTALRDRRLGRLLRR